MVGINIISSSKVIIFGHNDKYLHNIFVKLRTFLNFCNGEFTK